MNKIDFNFFSISFLINSIFQNKKSMLSIINLTVAQNIIETSSFMKIKFQILKFVDIDQKLL